jgi:hypothetical protein
LLPVAVTGFGAFQNNVCSRRAAGVPGASPVCSWRFDWHWPAGECLEQRAGSPLRGNLTVENNG